MNPGATGVFMEKIEKYINCKKEDVQEDLNDRVSRLAVDLNNAYYKEGNHPFEVVHDGFIRSIEALYEEYDIPLRPVLKEAIDALRKESNSDPCPDMQ